MSNREVLGERFFCLLRFYALTTIILSKGQHGGTSLQHDHFKEERKSIVMEGLCVLQKIYFLKSDSSFSFLLYLCTPFQQIGRSTITQPW